MESTARTDAWQALATDLETEMRDLRRRFADDATMLGRYAAAAIDDPADEELITRIADRVETLRELQLRLGEQTRLLARMRDAMEAAS